MTDTGPLRRALIARMLEGEGTASRSERRSAFENRGIGESLSTLIGKVALKAVAVTDADISAARVSGLTEDQIFEIVACAAVGQSARQYEAATVALELALRRE